MALLLPSRAPPLGRFLNMMNCCGQPRQCAVPRGASPRLLGQPASLQQASLLHASLRRQCRCCCVPSVPAEASQITERDMSTPWPSRAERRGGCCRVGRNRFGSFGARMIPPGLRFCCVSCGSELSWRLGYEHAWGPGRPVPYTANTPPLS